MTTIRPLPAVNAVATASALAQPLADAADAAPTDAARTEVPPLAAADAVTAAAVPASTRKVKLDPSNRKWNPRQKKSATSEACL
jgi:hypothetical protein